MGNPSLRLSEVLKYQPNISVLWVRGWLSMEIVVIQPYILVSKLKKTKTEFLRCTGYPNSIKTL